MIQPETTQPLDEATKVAEDAVVTQTVGHTAVGDVMSEITHQTSDTHKQPLRTRRQRPATLRDIIGDEAADEFNARIRY